MCVKCETCGYLLEAPYRCCIKPQEMLNRLARWLYSVKMPLNRAGVRCKSPGNLTNTRTYSMKFLDFNITLRTTAKEGENLALMFALTDDHDLPVSLALEAADILMQTMVHTSCDHESRMKRILGN